jgi:uncharacterized glyoxalase superfamily protein PhnB
MQTIFPILRYHDARAAIRALCAAFGFVEVFSVPEAGPFVRHAEITSPPLDTDFGSREYHACDLEGHPWTFGTYRPGGV